MIHLLIDLGIRILREIIIPAKYITARPFKNELAVVSSGLTDDWQLAYGVIDVNGNKVIDEIYYSIEDFQKDGKTWVTIMPSEESRVFQCMQIDTNEHILIGPVNFCKRVYNNLSGNIYVAELQNFFLEEIRYTFIDSKGHRLTDIEDNGNNLMSANELLSDVTPFTNGYAGIQVYKRDIPVWVFVDTTLSMRSDIYARVSPFSKGLAVVRDVNRDTNSQFFGVHGKCGVIDTSFNLVIPYKFDTLYSFKNGLAYFKNEVGTFLYEGYINRKGDVVWQTKNKIIK